MCRECADDQDAACDLPYQIRLLLARHTKDITEGTGDEVQEIERGEDPRDVPGGAPRLTENKGKQGRGEQEQYQCRSDAEQCQNSERGQIALRAVAHGLKLHHRLALEDFQNRDGQ
jgi:hypothetical protein